ncbi:MAG: hypothetical protein ACI85O_002006 [Saprospiraceae bacterium]|jgi:hypothetical protein
MKNLILTVALLATISFVGCIDDDGSFGCTAGSGSTVEETFQISNFKGLKLKCSADIFVTQGEEYSIIAESQANILDNLDLTLDGDVLEIDLDGCNRDFQLKLFITMPEVTFLKISGSGNIKGENLFSSENLTLRITGSGDMDLDLDYQTINTKITGSGSMDLRGICDEFDYTISGSGDINSFDLISDRGFVKITGSGDTEVFVNEFLSVKITGSGDVLFKGNPDEITFDITGSGDLRDVN